MTPVEIGITRYNFPCMGGCTMPMTNPNDARNAHRIDCHACKQHDYECNRRHEDLHKERTCTLYITTTGWFTNDQGELVYETRDRPCNAKHRWCTRIEVQHNFFRNKKGKEFPDGPAYFHEPQRPPSP